MPRSSKQNFPAELVNLTIDPVLIVFLHIKEQYSEDENQTYQKFNREILALSDLAKNSRYTVQFTSHGLNQS